MMNTQYLLTGICALGLMGAPVMLADTVAGTPDASVYHGFSRVGRAVASLPRLNDAAVNKSARYYIYLSSAGWCTPCNREMPRAVEAYGQMKESGKVEMLLLDFDHTEADARAYVEKFGVMFPATMGSNAPSLPGFTEPRTIPAAIIVDAEGAVVVKGKGRHIISNWKALIAEYEKAKGAELSFPES